jgi:hypothetical protein
MIDFFPALVLHKNLAQKKKKKKLVRNNLNKAVMAYFEKLKSVLATSPSAFEFSPATVPLADLRVSIPIAAVFVVVVLTLARLWVPRFFFPFFFFFFFFFFCATKCGAQHQPHHHKIA